MSRDVSEYAKTRKWTYQFGEARKEGCSVGTSGIHHPAHDVTQLGAVVDTEIVSSAVVFVLVFHFVLVERCDQI